MPTMEHQEYICACILNVIRETSNSGRLIRTEDISADLQSRDLPNPQEIDYKIDFQNRLNQTLTDNCDIKRIISPNGISYYYSSLSLSDTYAGILAQKSKNQLWLIAAVVRENSKLYPRPIPVESFSEPPFDLSPQAISECLEILGHDGEYGDIAQTVTSDGTIFLYSTEHLDPDHAFTLAEWLHVGLTDNP